MLEWWNGEIRTMDGWMIRMDDSGGMDKLVCPCLWMIWI